MKLNKNGSAVILIITILALIIICIFLYLIFPLKNSSANENCEKIKEDNISQQGIQISRINSICLKNKTIILRNELSFAISKQKLIEINSLNNEIRKKRSIQEYTIKEEEESLKCGLKKEEESLSYSEPFDPYERKYGSNITGLQIKSLFKSNIIFPERFNLKDSQNYKIFQETFVNGERIPLENCMSYFKERAVMLFG